jgi:hypothetical protein
MKRFILYTVLVPIVGTLVTIAYQLAEQLAYQSIVLGVFPIVPVLPLSLVVRLAYAQWLIPALAIATADRFIPLGGWPRFGTISVVGYFATLMTIGLLWGWWWGNLPLALIGAIAAFISCWLLDERQRGRLNDLVSKAHNSVKALRRWPC